MKKVSHLIVKYRRLVTVCVLMLAAACGVLSLKVPINVDMTRYLPPESHMKQGLDLMAEEFPDLAAQDTIRVMFEDLPSEREEEVQDTLGELPDVSSVVLTGHKQSGLVSHTLYTVSMDVEYRTPEALALEHSIPDAFPDDTVVVRNDDANGMEIPFYIYGIAVVILLLVLFVMCASYVEPFVFLLAIGAAILLNMGTNIILGSVSQTTYSMSAILQLVLSMDYSIILMNRFRQEREREAEKTAAMEKALVSAFGSIASSAFTTIVGLLMLCFMRFRIGRDLGLVLAKGVFLSMLCCLTLLPALILFFDGWITKSSKPVLRLPTRALSHFSYRFRLVLTAGFVILFFLAWYLQSLSGYSFSLSPEDPIADLFPNVNPIVLLYANEDEEAAADLAAELEEEQEGASVIAWSTTLGRKCTAQEMTDYLGELVQDGAGSMGAMAGSAADSLQMDPASFEQMKDLLTGDNIRLLYQMAAAANGEDPDTERASIEDLIHFLAGQTSNPLIRLFIGDDGIRMLTQAEEMTASARSMLTGPTHSMMVINTTLPLEGEETYAFLTNLQASLDQSFRGAGYLIGNSVMNQEMEGSFDTELVTITLLTALSIFLVVLLTFRNPVIPLVLVLLVQCGVFLTVATGWVIGYRIYYLAVVIVQCILMGATVDYGILFTNYYQETRRENDVPGTLEIAYDRSTHTILTSSMFMIFGTGAIGLSPADPTIAQICMSIAIGALAAVLLVIFVLPGILASADRLVMRKASFPQRKSFLTDRDSVY